MTINPPPLNQNITDKKGATVPQWLLWYDSMWRGDAGTDWTPTFTGLTETGGSATITGRYFQISRYLVFFSVTVTPVTDTSATAGTTYIDNFPLNFTQNGVVFAVAGNLGDGPGMITASDNNIYVPTWTAVTNPVTVIGICEVN